MERRFVSKYLQGVNDKSLFLVADSLEKSRVLWTLESSTKSDREHQIKVKAWNNEYPYYDSLFCNKGN